MLKQFFSFPNYVSFESFDILTTGFCIILIMCLIELIKSKSNFAVIFILSAISCNLGVIYLLLDAPDVAMTEASIGAALSTVILISFIKRVGNPSPTKVSPYKRLFALFASILVLGMFIYIGKDLPIIGKATNPINLGISDYYIENTEREIGIPAYVAAILASYRGFDTLGETTVIFLAAIAVITILGTLNEKELHASKDFFLLKPINYALKSNIIIKYTIRLILPYILIFAFYLQIFGEISPGGGFQAGTVLATCFIAYDLAFLFNNEILVSQNFLLKIAAAGVIIYSGVGVIAFFNGGNFLNYYTLGRFGSQELGIMLVELGVGITVACVMLAIYQEFKLND